MNRKRKEREIGELEPELEEETMTRSRHWLLKTEPSEWSWADQKASDGGVAPWDGVRNHQAIKNMKSMAPGDLCFFYHSGAADRRIVGVVEVVKSWYTNPEGGDGAVDVRSVGEMRRGVDLKEIKGEKSEEMKGFTLLKQPRLSVVPVSEAIWNRICEMGGGFGDEAAAPATASAPEQDE